MNYYLTHITYPILFVAVFARQLSLPVPALLFLLTGGALAGSGKLSFVGILLVAVLGCLLADLLWYEAGRLRGKRVLRLLCALTRDPSFCMRRGKEIFAKKGLRLLLIAKFVPGLDGICPPLAGMLGLAIGLPCIRCRRSLRLGGCVHRLRLSVRAATGSGGTAHLRGCDCCGSSIWDSAPDLVRLETRAACAHDPVASTAADRSRDVEVAIGFGGEGWRPRSAAL